MSKQHPRSGPVAASRPTSRANNAGPWQRFQELLSRPVSGASLAVCRMGVGLVMALEAYAMVVPHDAAITSGTPLDHYYSGSDIKFHFPYEGFEWLPMLPASWMMGLVGVLGVAGITMALGLWYRVSAIVVFSIWAYLFAVESTRTYWQSHYYLELLFCFLLTWMPAARRYSLDAFRNRKRSPVEPATVPFWTVFLLRGQLVIAYFYAGVAKLNADWFLDAVPVRWFLEDPNVTAPYERFLTAGQLETFTNFLHQAWLAYFLSYTGAIFDIVIGFVLLFRRSRIFGLVLMLIFHATNHLFIFDDIGWFPIVGAATALIFLDPDWPARFLRWLKRPSLSSPDVKWATIGGVVFPLVGATLGWSLKPTPPEPGEQTPFKLGRYVVPLVLAWLVWQAAVPMRHYFIGSDARFTYEGFSFSWRLKADTRHAIGHTMWVVDSKIIAPHPEARSTIDWSQWKYDLAMFRRVESGRVVWPGLPEVAVVLEPFVGERIIYNPYSGLSISHADDVAERRVQEIWGRLYGRGAKLVVPISLSQATEAIIADCTTAAVADAERTELGSLVDPLRQFEQGLANNTNASATLLKLQQTIRSLMENRETSEVVRPILRQLYPLALQGEQRRPAAFFLIDDRELLTESPEGLTQVNRANWKQDSATAQPGVPYDYTVGGTPLIVYMGAVEADASRLLPQAYITDVFGTSKIPPRIRWNSLRDMTMSKFMHASGQAFYLRRYARRVASLWEEKYGRRPKVQAETRVSYNGRPHQRLVDPEADLARVPVSWFSHNPWVMDLEMPRIPREAIEGSRAGYKREKRDRS